MVGILPLVETRGFASGKLISRRLSSLPRTPVAGVLADDREAAASLVRAAVEHVDTRPGFHLQLKAQATELDGLVNRVTRRPWRMSYAYQLPADPAEIRFGSSREHAAIKRAVNKARRSGVRVREAHSLQDLRCWYQLYLETMRTNAVPPRPVRFFEALWRNTRDAPLMQVLLAESAGRLIAGSIFLEFGGTMFYAFNGRRSDALSARPNDAIHWEAIQRACTAGYRTYDLGEVPAGNDGLAQYKRKWSNQVRMLYRYTYPSDAEAPQTPRGRAPFLEAAQSVWRRLPLAATAQLGDRIYARL